MEVCYRPPNQNEKTDKAFYKQLAEVIKSPEIAVMWDFNFHDTFWKHNRAQRKQSKRFLECVEYNFLTQLVSEPAGEVPC